MSSILTRAGTPGQDIHAVAGALSPLLDLRGLDVGQVFELAFLPGKTAPCRIRLAPTPAQRIELLRDASGAWLASASERPLHESLHLRSGIIKNSLFASGSVAQVPTHVLVELIHAFAFVVDFPRDIRRGDRFELIWRAWKDDDGGSAGREELCFAALTLSGRRLAYWSFRRDDGRRKLFDASGASIRKTLLRTPIDGARLTSHFGQRRHPVLGYSKIHRGVDFGAPIGTPIYAAGDGTVERAGLFGSYGRYLRIRHNGSYETAYAHLSAFAKGIRPSQSVRQGEVIGYVGRSGRTNGPHLHFEILVSGRQVDPRNIELPSGEALTGEDLQRFATVRRSMEGERNRLRLDALYAAGNGM